MCVLCGIFSAISVLLTTENAMTLKSGSGRVKVIGSYSTEFLMCHFLLVINGTRCRILYSLWDIAFDGNTEHWKRLTDRRSMARELDAKRPRAKGDGSERSARLCRQKSVYPNVTTLRSCLCYRKSVCLSVCCVSVTFVCRTQGVKHFGNISSPLCTLAILWPSCKILRRLSEGNPSVGGVKRKRGSKIERRWTQKTTVQS